MKYLVRFAVAGALMASFATAQAQTSPAVPPLPSSGSADLWLFVSDPSASQSFAEDTGISLSSILPTTSLVSGATLATSVSANFSVAASAALTSFINSANAAGQTLDWAVLGGQYAGGTDNSSAAKKAGGSTVIASEPTAQGANIEQLVLANIETINGGINGDVSYLGTNGYAAGGSVYKWANGSAGGNVWGASMGGNGGATDLYGQGPDQNGITLGGTTGLFGLVTNGGTGQLQSYILGDNLTLSSNGVLSISSGTSTSPVPLPAAVWLFGSGLLGLLGVGRRRAATQA
jgi:hypothetical protein